MPNWRKRLDRQAARGCLAAAGMILLAPPASAVPYELIYTGYFNESEALNLATAPSPSFFSDDTAFELRARFDDSSPNLAPPSPPAPPPFAGFRAYAPTSMWMQIGGTTYSVSGSDNPGLSVSIFDRNSFVPGFYGVGVIVDPVADGAGIIGDFASASPDFTVDALVPTVFGGYRGVGHSSGACVSGFPPDCEHLVTPIVLRDDADQAWNLTLAFYELDPPDQALNTARIVAVPEPSSVALLLAGLAGAGVAGKRRRAG